MKAVVLTKPCEAMEMTLSEVPVPSVKPGWVLIKVNAFGINHSEVLLRKFEIEQPYINKPIIPGIECVGTIADRGDTRFKNGERVMALMGGMGRNFNGSYAEYVLIPESHVFSVDSSLANNQLGAIPETFYTAYGSLVLSLQINSEDTLLIRGGTSTVGLAALQLAKAVGAKVIATTRNESRSAILKRYGADDVMIECDNLYKSFLNKYPHGATKVIELIGAKTLRDSLKLTSVHGIVCHTGLLGGIFGIKNFDPIKEIPSGVYLTGFYSNNPTQKEIDGMMSIIDQGNIRPIIAHVFNMTEIADAHALAEQRGLTGKIVVTV